jgi:hypothetical protein
MINIAKYKERFATAQQEKADSKFREKILEELSKPEWNERKSALDKSLSSIKEEKDFDKYQKELAKLFDDIFEIITAPGVDAFTNWLNNLTDNKNENDVKKLRNFFVNDYITYSDFIDSILDNKDAFNFDDKSIFVSLLNEYKKGIKKICTDFLAKPDEFEHNIDGFLQDLDNTLSGLSKIPELSYNNIEQLYTEQQKNDNIDFYTDIITKIVEENQSLKAIDDSEKNDSILDKINARIDDINKCIKLLCDTKIANNQDKNIKNLFLKFDDKMVDAKKGIYDFLEKFIDNEWNGLETNYFKIKEHFDNVVKLSANQTDWDSFLKKNKINSLIEDYNLILADNPQQTILNLPTKDIAKTLERKVTAVEKYKKSEVDAKNEIIEVFETLTTEYEKKIPLLDGLLATNTALEKLVQDIKDSIDGLNNGRESLDNKDLIAYLNEDFTSDLNTYNNLRTWFNEVLQKSGMSGHLKWLDARLNNTESGKISETDFDADVLKELLSKGLITLRIEKTF